MVWYNGKRGDAGFYYTNSSGASGSPFRIRLATGDKVTTAHGAVAALEGGGALAAYDVNAEGDRRISVAHLPPGRSQPDQLTLPGLGDGKYRQLAIVDDTTAVLAWTASDSAKSRVRLARLHWH